VSADSDLKEDQERKGWTISLMLVMFWASGLSLSDADRLARDRKIWKYVVSK